MELANENIDYKPLDKKFDMTQFSKARTGVMLYLFLLLI